MINTEKQELITWLLNHLPDGLSTDNVIEIAITLMEQPVWILRMLQSARIAEERRPNDN